MLTLSRSLRPLLVLRMVRLTISYTPNTGADFAKRIVTFTGTGGTVEGDQDLTISS